MANVRLKFRIPYAVKNGSDVMNEYGQSVGFVIGCEMVPKSDSKHNINTHGNVIDGSMWEIEADVDESAVKGKLQCMEPIMPVQ